MLVVAVVAVVVAVVVVDGGLAGPIVLTSSKTWKMFAKILISLKGQPISRHIAGLIDMMEHK